MKLSLLVLSALFAPTVANDVDYMGVCFTGMDAGEDWGTTPQELFVSQGAAVADRAIPCGDYIKDWGQADQVRMEYKCDYDTLYYTEDMCDALLEEAKKKFEETVKSYNANLPQQKYEDVACMCVNQNQFTGHGTDDISDSD